MKYFKCDTKNGIIYSEEILHPIDKANAYYQLLNINSETNVINTLQIKLVDGISLDYQQLQHILCEIKNVIKIDDELNIQFIDIDCNINSHIMKLINYICTIYDNYRLNFIFTFKDYYNKIKYICDNIDTINKMHFNINVNSINNTIIDIINTVGDNNITFNINNTIDYDINKTIKNIEIIKNDVCIDNIISKLDINNDVTLNYNTLCNNINKIKYEYGIFFPFGMRHMCINIGSKLSNTLYDTNYFIKLMEIEPSLYILHPFDIRNCSNCKTFNINPNGYSICQYVPLSKSINKAMKLKQSYSCNTNNICKKCEFSGFCTLCDYYNCNLFPTKHEFNKLIIAEILKRPEKWLITKNIIDFGD